MHFLILYCEPCGYLERAEQLAAELRERTGATIDVELLKYGFMPAGGGKLKATIMPGDGLTRLDLVDRGAGGDVTADAFFANLPFDVAEREVNRIGERLSLKLLPADQLAKHEDARRQLPNV